MIANDLVGLNVKQARLILKGWIVLRIAITTNDTRLCSSDPGTDCDKEVGSECVGVHLTCRCAVNLNLD